MATRLGKPAIPDPRAFDIRAFQLSVSNIRQRIEALEGLVDTLLNAGSTTSLAAALAALQARFNAFVAGNGTVTSVAATVPSFMSVSGSPITTAGVLSFTFDEQAPGLFLAGPVSGANAVPDFRAIEWYYDIPLYTTTPMISGLDGSEAILIERYGNFYWTTVDQVRSGGGSGGTVTSVALTTPSFLSVSGSPITTAGTLAVTLANQNPGEVFIGPVSGAPAAPTFRDLQWYYDIPLYTTTPMISGLDGSEAILIERYGNFYWVTTDQIAALAGSGAAASRVDTYTATGSSTWTKFAGAKAVQVILVGGGGGGGSGSASNTSVGQGGGGGGGGCRRIVNIDPSDLGSTETVVVGVGGTGGAPVTTTLTGNPGTVGGTSSFATKFSAYGGGGGGGGTNAPRSGGSGGGPFGAGNPGVGGAGSVMGEGAAINVGALTFNGPISNTTPPTNPWPEGGAFGGGNATGAATGGPGGLAVGGGMGGGAGGNSGGSGGGGKDATGSIVAAGGTVGVAGGTVGGIASGYIGAGGGGGGGRTGATPPAAGGAGQQPGGGGGGGGGTDQVSVASGAGANGGNGMVVVITFF